MISRIFQWYLNIWSIQSSFHQPNRTFDQLGSIFDRFIKTFGRLNVIKYCDKQIDLDFTYPFLSLQFDARSVTANKSKSRAKCKCHVTNYFRWTRLKAVRKLDLRRHQFGIDSEYYRKAFVICAGIAMKRGSLFLRNVVWIGSRNPKHLFSFYSMPDCNNWKY